MPPVRAFAVLLAAFIAVGCGSTSEPRNTASDAETNVSRQWTTLTLTDVSGTSFSIADFKGKSVVVENFATWCSNCRRQLGDTQKAAAAVGSDAVFIALSVETTVAVSKVAEYAKEHGFRDIRFAVMSDDFLSLTNEVFGTSSVNPPSTPKILVDTAGVPGKAVTGFESPKELAARITAAS